MSNTTGGQDEESEVFKRGLQIRREVLGDEYVDKALAGALDPFAKPGQQYVTEVCWGGWLRPGLDKKRRSLLNIGILMALNRSTEFAVHIRGAINNGLTIYVGVPAGVEAYKVASKVIQEMKAESKV